jgi:hypothetical protein
MTEVSVSITKGMVFHDLIRTQAILNGFDGIVIATGWDARQKVLARFDRAKKASDVLCLHSM